MRKITLCTLLLLASCSTQEPISEPGPFERAGKNIDSTVTQVGEKSEEIAEKTVTGARKVTKKVADSVGQAASWVSRSVSPEEQDSLETSPTPSPMPPQ